VRASHSCIAHSDLACNLAESPLERVQYRFPVGGEHAVARTAAQARQVGFRAEQLAGGRDMEAALKELCAVFDGFYTLLVSNRDSFAVVRDAIACKPAVIAETDDWVAMGSEYRALAGLPGVEAAKIWEPEPEVVYAWNR